MTDMDNIKIGCAIRNRRITQGITQEALAREIKVTQQSLQRYESGKIGVPARKLQPIATALGVEPGYFFSANFVPPLPDPHPVMFSPSTRVRQLAQRARRLMSMSKRREEAQAQLNAEMAGIHVELASVQAELITLRGQAEPDQ